jgi:hypothetical protein
MKDSSDQPKPAKRGRDRVPPPQRLRIMQKYVAGESFVQIGREEHRDRDTVARIVKSDEMQEFLRQMREQFYGLAGDAIEAVRYALQNERDGRLGFQLLSTMGVIPSEAERSTLAPTQSSDDAEQAAVATEVGKLAFLTINMSKTFGQPLPHVAEVEPAQEEPQT